MYKIYEIETKILIEKQVFKVIYLVGTDVSARDHFNIEKYITNCPVSKKFATTLNQSFECVLVCPSNKKKNIKTFLIMK